MDFDEKQEEQLETQTQETTEEKPESVSAEDRLKRLEEDFMKTQGLVEYYKSEAEKWRNEAKTSFEKRDKVKQELKLTNKEDVVAYTESLKEQLQEYKSKLESVEKDRQNEKKINLLKKYATEKGIHKQYVDKIDRFVDIDSLNLDSEILFEHTVSVMYNEYPHLFGSTAVPTTPAAPVTTQQLGSLEEEYKKELNKLPGERNEARLLKIAEELNKVGRYKRFGSI